MPRRQDPTPARLLYRLRFFHVMTVVFRELWTLFLLIQYCTGWRRFHIFLRIAVNDACINTLVRLRSTCDVFARSAMGQSILSVVLWRGFAGEVPKSERTGM